MSGEENADKPQVDPERLDISDASDREDSLEVSSGEAGKVKTNAATEQGMEFDDEGGVKSTEAEDDGAQQEPEKSEPGDAPEDLGEWKADDAEVSAKFDERYLHEDGSALNMEAFAKEVAANLAKDGGEAELNAGTYGWLKDRMGVSKEYVDSIIAGQMALREKREGDFYGLVGGKDLYEQKLKWASGVYTADQKKRFNDAIAAGGEQAKEAVELLNARWEKAGNKAPADPKPSIGLRRAATPQKTTSMAETAAGDAGVKPFADEKEHRAAMKEAGDDRTKQALVRKRLLVSPWFKNRQG